jgi:hypothetical protein
MTDAVIVHATACTPAPLAAFKNLCYSARRSLSTAVGKIVILYRSPSIYGWPKSPKKVDRIVWNLTTSKKSRTLFMIEHKVSIMGAPPQTDRNRTEEWILIVAVLASNRSKKELLVRNAGKQK